MLICPLQHIPSLSFVGDQSISSLGDKSHGGPKFSSEVADKVIEANICIAEEIRKYLIHSLSVLIFS
jgi:hypothetical protein